MKQHQFFAIYSLVTSFLHAPVNTVKLGLRSLIAVFEVMAHNKKAPLMWI